MASTAIAPILDYATTHQIPTYTPPTPPPAPSGPIILTEAGHALLTESGHVLLTEIPI